MNDQDIRASLKDVITVSHEKTKTKSEIATPGLDSDSCVRISRRVICSVSKPVQRVGGPNRQVFSTTNSVYP